MRGGSLRSVGRKYLGALVTGMLLLCVSCTGPFSSADRGAPQRCPVTSSVSTPSLASSSPPPLTALGPSPSVRGGPPAGTPTVTWVNRFTFGLNVAAWDPHAINASTDATVRRLGVGVLQWPNTGAAYSWQRNAERDAASHYSRWDSWHEWMSIDQWGAMLRATGTTGLYIVDYGSNAEWTGGAGPSDARSVTCYILAHHIPVRAMVIGSEAYGSWTIDLHPVRTAAEYAAVAAKMAQAIHAVDPKMPVGVDVVDPVTPTSGREARNWNQTVLRLDAPYIQFVSAHAYPETAVEDDARLLQVEAAKLPTSIHALKRELHTYAGRYAPRIQVWVTEFAPYGFTPSAQSVEAVYGGALLEGTLLQITAGARQVDWWDLHNEAYTAASAGRWIGTTDNSAGTRFGTFGLASTGVLPQPALNALYPAGDAYARLMQVVTRGAILRTWPDLLTGSGVFIAEVWGHSSGAWVLVNNRRETVTVRVENRTIKLLPTSWRIVEESRSNGGN